MEYSGTSIIPRTASSFVDDFCDGPTGIPMTMTDEIATRNLNLLAAFMESNYLRVNSKDSRELILSPSPEDDCEWPLTDTIAKVIEVSYGFQKGKREAPNIPTLLEEQALTGLRKAIDVMRKQKEDVQELEEVVGKLMREWPIRLPEDTSVAQRAFSPYSYGGAAAAQPSEAIMSIRRVDNSSAWPPAHTPVAVDPLQGAPSPQAEPRVVARREDDFVERLATGVAQFILGLGGLSDVSPSATGFGGEN